MGTSKKIVLASLVSMLMVLGFLVGLAPSGKIQTEASTAAGDTIDMVGLLDLVLGVKGVSGVTLSSPVEGVVVKTPEDNAEVPEIPVPVQANVVGDGSELVTFAANEAEDATAFPAANTWVGDVFTEPAPSPFVSALDVSSFLTLQAGTQTEIAVYALVNASAAVTKATLTYESANEGVDALPLTIFETDGNVDGDNNGLPDDLFNEVAPGEIWISNQEVNGALRTVLVANLDSGAKGNPLGTIFTSPNGNVQVESPALQEFIDAGLIDNGESGFLVVDVVDDLVSAIDRVYGGGNVADWAATVGGLQPGALLAGAQFVEISLVYSLYSGTQFDEIETLPGALAINLTVNNVPVPANTDAGLYSYPTSIAEDGGNIIIESDATGTWSEVDATFAGGGLQATLTSLSVFAPLGIAIDTTVPLAINAAAPNTVAENLAGDVTLTGVFGTSVALNAAAAAANYTVTVGGVAASFREVAGEAITAYTGSGTNLAHITVPANADPGFYDVTITDVNDPSNTATAAGLIEVLATSDLATSVAGGIGTITVTPANGTGLPAGTYFTESVVSAEFVYDPNQKAVEFAGWLRNGVDVGSDNPINIIVGDNADDDAVTTLVAQLITSTNFYTLDVSATAGGTAVAITAPNGPGGTYAEGSVVTIEATANAGFEFTGWTGSAVADANAANTTITIAGDSAVTANFAPIAYTIDLTVDGNEGGSVAILTPPNHPNGVDYLLGTVITIAATPEDGYQFDGWAGADAGALDDASAATTSFTIDGSQQSYAVAATFSLVPVGDPTITGITPNEAWIFGGVVARISGTNLTNDTIITIGGVTVQGFRAFSNGSSVDVVIPASTDNTTAATVLADVTVGDDDSTATLPNGFTYKRYQTEGGVNSTAFIVDNPEIGTTVDVTLNGDNNSFAELEIPALDVPAGAGEVFGIARNAIVGGDDDKGNTSPISALGTNSIASGSAIAGISDFSLHLYVFDDGSKGNTDPVGSNTPSVGSGTFTSATGLVDFSGPVGPDGSPVDSTPILLTFPLAGSGITYGDVRNSLTLWGVQTEFDYVTEVTTVSDPEVVEYQSEILNTEVDPELVPASADGAEPTLISQARIYSLNGFSLRQDAILPADSAEAIRLANTTGTASGDVAGGTALRVISPNGGLGHIDRIVFTEASRGKVVGGTVTAANIITPAGETEFEVEFTSPASADKGIANIVIFGKADPATPIVQLDRVFEYTKEPRDLTPLVLLLLGVLVAALGLAAGGDSGGGGGGPCFIATAAYGTPMAAEIDTLRDFRDTYLLSNTVGSAFTDAYYRVSPAIADAVAQSPVLAAVVRVLLVPVIFLGKVAMAMPVLTLFIGLSLGFACFMARRRAGRSTL